MSLVVELRSRGSNTNWLSLEFNENEPPTALIDALGAIGWKNTMMFVPPALNGRIGIDLNLPGKAQFAGWTPAEKKANIKALNNVLSQNGVKQYGVRKMTLADMM